ncbi:MAG: metallophosphoesterase [Clostridia bacterium]|nr:metallophosphoesterase [Clostridia bacterium]
MFEKLFTTVVLILTLFLQNLFVLPVRHAQDVQLKAVLIADIHADADFTRDRMDNMREMFAAIGRTQNDADTIVMAGDLTNSGSFLEYVHLQNCLNAYCRIPDRVPEMGNHDSWNHSDDPDYGNAERYFKSFCRWNGIKTENVYYTKRVNGVPFIVLGVEACDFGDPYHSETQLNWFERELNAAVTEGTPVFVVCHRDFRNLGESAGRMRQILTDASLAASAPIIFVSGHYHTIGANTYKQQNDKLIFLNLPSMQYTDDRGLMFLAEVTANTVTLTGTYILPNAPAQGYAYTIAY